MIVVLGDEVLDLHVGVVLSGEDGLVCEVRYQESVLSFFVDEGRGLS